MFESFQDEFALRSHQKAHKATEEGLLKDLLDYKVPGLAPIKLYVWLYSGYNLG